MSRENLTEEAKRALRRGITRQNLQDIEGIFEQYRIPQDILDKSLAIACGFSSLEIINYFIEGGASVINDAFDNAFCVGNMEIVNRLLEVRTPNLDELNSFLVFVCDNDCDRRRTIIPKLIQEGANINCDGGKPLTIACKRNLLPLVILLLRLGANPTTDIDDSNSALYYAIENNNIDMIRRLFDAGVQVDSNDIKYVIENLINELQESESIENDIQKITATVEELVRYDIFPKWYDIKTTIQLRQIFNVEQFATLLNSLLVPGIRLPNDTIRSLENLNMNLNMQNIVPFTDEEEEKLSLQLQQETEDMLDIVEDMNEDMLARRYAERNSSENRTRARQIEQENEAKRQAALEEYKTTEAEMETQPIEVKVNAHCYPTSHSTIMGDTLKDSDDFVIFLVEGSEKGDCYLRSELLRIAENPEAFEFKGPPFGISGGNYRGPRGPDESKPVFKLPWTNIWIDRKAMEKGSNSRRNLITLRGERQSIGSEYGNMTGQLGGHWGTEGAIAVYVESGDFEPDNRPIVYRYIRGEHV